MDGSMDRTPASSMGLILTERKSNFGLILCDTDSHRDSILTMPSNGPVAPGIIYFTESIQAPPSTSESEVPRVLFQFCMAVARNLTVLSRTLAAMSSSPPPPLATRILSLRRQRRSTNRGMALTCQRRCPACSPGCLLSGPARRFKNLKLAMDLL